MKKLQMIVLAFVLSFLFAAPAHALDVSVPSPELPNSPLLISAYDTGTDELRSVELYNSSNNLVNLNEWQLQVSWESIDGTTTPPESFLLPIVSTTSPTDPSIYLEAKQHTVLSFNESVPSASLQVNGQLRGGEEFYVSRLALVHSGFSEYGISISAPQSGVLFLGETSTGYTSTGRYYQYPHTSIRETLTLYDSGVYQLGVNSPRTFPLVPVEILANPQNCSPSDTRTICREYIKFYNDTPDVVDFKNTALNIGTLSRSKRIQLQGSVQPGEYIIFDRTEDGGMLDISNSGGYVWLSDRHGIAIYDSTIREYADASSSAHKGQSWAFIDGVWQWGLPTPGAGNRIVPPLVCASNQVMNPETGRCNKIQVSTLTPCLPSQYRSSETNRCRNIASTANTLTPCRTGQYRSAETNRCRNLVSTASGQLKPCQPGQERNPTTNRCRKVANTDMPAAGYAIESIEDEVASSLGWLAFAGVGSMAAGYGVWEWRRELGRALQRLRTFLPF